MLGKPDCGTEIVALGYCLFLRDMKFDPLTQIKSDRRMVAIRKRVEVASADLERFVSEQNIVRYRKLLGESKDEAQRLTIAKLLADEVAKLRKM
jgi:hypothetical protein